MTRMVLPLGNVPMHIEIMAPFSSWGRTMRALGDLGDARITVETGDSSLYLSGIFGSAEKPVWAHFRMPTRGRFGGPAYTDDWQIHVGSSPETRLTIYHAIDRRDPITTILFRRLEDEVPCPAGPILLSFYDLSLLEPYDGADRVHLRTSADGELSIIVGGHEHTPRSATRYQPHVSVALPGHLLRIGLRAGFLTHGVIADSHGTWLVTPTGVEIGAPLS